MRTNPFKRVACRTQKIIEEPKKTNVKTSHIKRQGKITYLGGGETPEPIATKFCMPGAIQDVITPANFCEDRFNGFGVARGRSLAFSTDLLRRL